jgi:hypothetical protein
MPDIWASKSLVPTVHNWAGHAWIRPAYGIRRSSRVGQPTDTLQRHNTDNSKQIFPMKGAARLQSPFLYIHVSVSDLYIPLIGLPILLLEKYVGRTWKYICRSLTDK